jgi:precorrin-6A/cobalt-precorrin-6A reductase
VILLLGGTGDTDPVARALLSRGQEVLVSTVTDYPLTLTPHPDIKRRFGALDEASLRKLIRDHRIVAVVDATHPYAEIIGPLGRKIAAVFGIPYFRFLRPKACLEKKDAICAEGHQTAAKIACSFDQPILLTIGSKNIDVYVRGAKQKQIPLYIRVLDRKDSIDACHKSGVPAEAVIAAKGPFTVKDNVAMIQQFDIGVLVTKESGEAGGIKAKVEAAESTGCRLVIVDRPLLVELDTYSEIDTLIAAIFRTIQDL